MHLRGWWKRAKKAGRLRNAQYCGLSTVTKRRFTMDDEKCPACGAEGKGVKATTLRSLLRPEKQTLIGDYRYFFCGSPECEIVYFTKGSSRTFIKADLTVRVGVKEVSPPRPICYCFGHSMEEIFNEVERTGKSTVADEI